MVSLNEFPFLLPDYFYEFTGLNLVSQFQVIQQCQLGPFVLFNAVIGKSISQCTGSLHLFDQDPLGFTFILEASVNLEKLPMVDMNVFLLAL